MIPLKKYPDLDFVPGAAAGNRGDEGILPGVVAACSAALVKLGGASAQACASA